MSGLSRRLEQLEAELHALGEETMLVEELDGFIAGLLVCPDLIAPSKWLPLVWNSEGGDAAPAFDDLDHANRVLGLIMEHYNDVVRTLMEEPERYQPLLPVDGRNDDIIWEVWADGFDKAVALRPEAWRRLLLADADTSAAMNGLLMLADAAQRVPAEHDAIGATVSEDIARWVVALHAWRIGHSRPARSPAATARSPFTPARKVGRNEPCPCGSGKKYKRCCGLN